MITFQEEIQSVINYHSAESPSGTPDFILAEYLNDCLKAFNSAVIMRAKWRNEEID